jgi:rubredoxin
MAGTLTFLGVMDDGRWAWDYTCGCGQRYRVAAARAGARFWPAHEVAGDGAASTPAGALCFGCGAALSLDRSFHPEGRAGPTVRSSDRLPHQPERVERLSRYRCAHCGYGASCRSAPERCPMCGGTAWEDGDVRQPWSRPEAIGDGDRPTESYLPPSAA